MIFRCLFLAPFALLYYIITQTRNYIYDKQYIISTAFSFPVISIGNLAVGGTGKTPHIAYCVAYFSQYLAQHKIAVVSRGYKRKSKGFVLANMHNASAAVIGDEPALLYQLFPKCIIAVDERRVSAIKKLQHTLAPQLVLLDDAFQHRAVKATLQIIVSDYNKLFIHDYIMPLGSLREAAYNYARANIIIVSKCPPQLSKEKRQQVRQAIRAKAHQHIVFSYIQYTVVHALGQMQQQMQLSSTMQVLLVCGIANPKPLYKHLQTQVQQVSTLYYNDHHAFSSADLHYISKRFKQLSGTQKCILTSAKDAIRLRQHLPLIKKLALPIYVQQINIQFFPSDAQHFNHLLYQHIKPFAGRS